MWRRRRTVLNEALHELRRPLQAIALAGSVEGAASAPAGVEGSMRMAASALERLDREINGGPAPNVAEAFCVDSLLATTVERWQARAALSGSTLALRDTGDGERSTTVDPLVGDPWAVAQALDNLVVNAIEHGGPRILVSVSVAGDRLRISVRDCGRPLARPEPGSGRSVQLGARIRGRARHGHGLRVVRRVARQHEGGFALTRTPGGAEAVLELAAR